MGEQSFFFYDLETSGLRPREDRIMQFAGQRTDLDLNPVGEPVNLLVKMTNDALPSPGAIRVTKITPQETLEKGISEAEFCRYVTEEVFWPKTIAVGFNTVRFDDEFMRAIFWRNFYDPYEFEWKDGRGRWDILDMVRLTRALRPEGVNWPVTEDGKATNRLELITKLNGISHEHAHDALGDVFATIAVAKLIKEKQPQLFQYLLKMREKNELKKVINLENKRPFVYASGRYPAEFNKTTVVVPLTSGRNGNILVYDLRYSLGEVLKSVKLGQSEPEAEGARKSVFPIVKEFCYNKCPAVAPLGVLEEKNGWEKIGLTREEIEKNWREVMERPDFAEAMRTKMEERAEFPPAEEPEGAIYEGFLNDMDKNKVGLVRGASANQLADLHPDFVDERLPELLLHYKGRNFPKCLSETESEEWEKYRRARLEKQAPGFLRELEKLYAEDDFLAEELKLYFESLAQ